MFDPETRNVDLHMHTTASDGDRSPTELVALAKEAGLGVIAVTDHDTTDGLLEALEAGREMGVEVIPGVEVSAFIETGQCHILGLGIDPQHAGLQTRLADIQYRRVNRNTLMIEKLNSLDELKSRGIQLTLAEVEAQAGGDIVARPHFARVLMAHGLVNSVQEAFDEYLAEGKKGNVAKDKVTQEEAIQWIHDAGGVAILAHPNNLKRASHEETESYILQMCARGLDGIEARYNLHTPEDNARYVDLAARHGLLTSGGSDYHGVTIKPKVYLGAVERPDPTKLEGQPAPYALVTAIQERIR